MRKRMKVKEFSQKQKSYYNDLPIINLDRLFGYDDALGLVVQDGMICGMEIQRCGGKFGKMVVVTILIFVFLIGFVLTSRAEGGRQGDWKQYIEELCEQRHICPELVETIIERESGWDPEAVNGDCIGLMQISQISQWPRMQKLGVVDLKNPYENILVGVDLLEELFQRYEDPAAVLMYYNAGYSDKSGLEAYLWDEMSDYALQVLEQAAELERVHGK